MRSQFRQMRKPPNAGVSRILPKIAMYGLQIVSPSGGCGDVVVAGIDDPGPGIEVGNGGGPAAGIGIVGSGGGFAGVVAAVSAAAFPASVFSSADADAGASDFALGKAARNSEIGFHADFVSSHARSVALRLPSATFSRMADSEKRPAYCPFRCTQISTRLI